MPYCLNLHLFRKVMAFEVEDSTSLKAVYECQLRCGGDLPLLLPTVLSLPSRLRRGRASGRGCAEMSALSEMTTSVSKRTESSRGPLSLWHCCWGCRRRCGFVPAPEHVLCWCYWLLVGSVGMVTDFHIGCVSPGLCLSYWCTSKKGSVFYISLLSRCIPASD